MAHLTMINGFVMSFLEENGTIEENNKLDSVCFSLPAGQSCMILHN